MTTHKLKIAPKYFADVGVGVKKFEVRKNDRNFEPGDMVEFHEFVSGEHTGAKLGPFEIKYVLPGENKYGLAEDYCVFCW